MKRIYLDNNATTQIDSRVLKSMLDELEGPPSNPSSPHFFGREAKMRLISAREKIASFFQVLPEEVIFTSGGTESINLALQGLDPNCSIITTEIEHAATYQTLLELEKRGFTLRFVPVHTHGAPSPEEIESLLSQESSAIVLSAVNSETGVKIDLKRIAQIAKAYQVPLIIDAVALIGKEKFIMHEGISALAISAHKFHGPKGIGALIVRKSHKIRPLLLGGGQEKMKRSGTENLAGILGLQKAIEILQEEQDDIEKHIRDLRDLFEDQLKKALPDLLINGEGPRVSNVSNLFFPSIDAETLLMQLDLQGVAASHGSACSSGALQLSRVLRNMGLERQRVRSSLRFSFSKMNTKEEIERAVSLIAQSVKALLPIEASLG